MDLPGLPLFCKAGSNEVSWCPKEQKEVNGEKRGVEYLGDPSRELWRADR